MKPIPWWQVDLGPDAASAAAEAITNRCLSQGPITAKVEKEMAALLNTKYAIATSSGSTALTLALMAAGAQPGDSVICPAYTWIATAHAAHILGCSVELVDILPDMPVMDVDQVPAATEKRRFAVPVHMNGHAVDVQGLKNLGYTVIEDAAQALGSKSSQGFLGTIGDMGCFSFSVAKIIGSGQGGLVVTNSQAFAEHTIKLRTHGVHDVFAPSSWEHCGHNFRYNDPLAAVLLTQIPLLAMRLKHAKSIAKHYIENLSELDQIKIVQHRTVDENGPYLEAQTSSSHRNGLIDYLSLRHIGARPAFPTLESARYLYTEDGGSFPNSNEWSRRTLYLPSGPGITFEMVDQVCVHIKAFFSS